MTTNTWEYTGDFGTIEEDADAHVIFVRVTNVRTIITFEGDTVAEVERAFRDSVDRYLAWCA